MCPERLENFLLGDVQQPPRYGPGHSALGVPARTEVSSNLNNSVFHDNLIQETAAFPAEPCELFMSSKKYLPSTSLVYASCYFFLDDDNVLTWFSLKGYCCMYHAHIYTHRTMLKH